MTVYEQKHAMYLDYCNELDEFREVKRNDCDEEIREWCDYYIGNDDCSWINIFDPETKALVGFIIIGKDGAERHPEADYGIAQAYVKPEFRRKGLMRQTLHDYMARHTGIYGLFVLTDNVYANTFWNDFFESEGYTPYHLDEKYVNFNGDDLILYGFAPKM